MRLRKRIVGIREHNGAFTALDDSGTDLKWKLSTREIISIQKAMSSYELLSMQEKFRRQLGYLPLGDMKAALEHIYIGAHENSIEAGRDAAEKAFTICIDIERDDADSAVRDFLDNLLD